ncbi:hypothetical protein CRV15_17720 [Streptomyces clavuligerus]|nr:hypothetical protein D1794_18365 [Streptomyces clavuligerus]QCS07297.1 hypothetical protein CRV15_17720 [Streptomyces clavuligerus]
MCCRSIAGALAAEAEVLDELGLLQLLKGLESQPDGVGRWLSVLAQQLGKVEEFDKPIGKINPRTGGLDPQFGMSQPHGVIPPDLGTQGLGRIGLRNYNRIFLDRVGHIGRRGHQRRGMVWFVAHGDTS